MKLLFLLSLTAIAAPFCAFAYDEMSCNSVFFNPENPNYFNLVNFSAYPEILRDDSSITLAQAGSYKGPAEFKEYVAFATSLSPYFALGPVQNAGDLSFLGYNNDTDTCEYLATTQVEYLLDDAYTNSAEHFNLTYMIKYQLVLSEPRYLKRAFVFYPIGFLDFFFHQLSNEKAVNYICGELANSCNNTMDGEPRDTCVANLLDLPVLTGTNDHSDGDGDGVAMYADGNSLGCRALHVVLAGSSPQLHCPHVALTPTEDPNGNIKCQHSSLYDPANFFTPQELSIFEQFQIDLGVDPVIGYTLFGDSPSLLGDDEAIMMEEEVDNDDNQLSGGAENTHGGISTFLLLVEATLFAGGFALL